MDVNVKMHLHMSKNFLELVATTSSLVAAVSLSAATNESSLYDRAVAILRERYFDKEFRENKLDELARRYRACAAEAKNVDGQRDCLTKLLSHLPASHLCVLSQESFKYLMGELSGEKRPTFGLLGLRVGDDYFTSFVLEGGPAAAAGVLPWERIISIDGKPTAQSERLDYPQKDAYLRVDRDPPMQSILCREGDEITLVLEPMRNQERTVTLQARSYSALEAARASARVVSIDGLKVGYVHFWFIHSSGVLELLRELFDGPFAQAEGLLLDLRGRGGNGVVVEPLLKMLSDWGRPIVGLTDRQSRSAKDALAYEFKQRGLATVVGERTTGAVIPASFAQIGDDTVLMFPSFTLGEYTEKLELKGGVEPDVFVERAGPYSGGKDPILERGIKEMLRLASRPGRDAAPRRPIDADTSGNIRGPIEQTRLPDGAARRPYQELPPLDLLVRNMIDSLGGEEKLRAHRHRTLIGKAELVGLPMKGDYVQKASAPDKSLVVMQLGDLLVRQGFDGITAWSETPMQGLQILSGGVADAMKRQAKFFGPLDLIAANKEIRPTQFVIFDDKECIELKLVGLHGDVSFLYVDAQTFLIAGSKTSIETPIGAVESKTYLRDYQEFNGYKTATEIFVESSVQRQRIKIENVTFDPIAPDEYAVPKSTR